MSAVCLQCAKELPPLRSAGKPRRWCSDSCRVKAYRLRVGPKPRPSSHAPRCAVFIRDCAHCGKTWVGRGSRAKLCSTECSRAFWTAHQRSRYQADPEVAARRVREQRATRTPEQVKRDRERARRWNEQAGYHASKRAGDARRRLRMTEAAVESFGAAEIYERDRWRCGICSKKVRASLKHPHPMSASLDHVVPLSLGGEHTRANTRLAHLSCNVSRGNRMGVEQLSLIG